MSPRPSSRSAPLPSRMTRESILEETLNAIRDGRFALMTPVRTSTEGRCVATTRWMPDGARLLRQPDDRLLDFLGRRHHEVGQLVDDDHDERHRLELQVGLVRVLRAHARDGLGVLDRRVVLLGVADLAEVGERLESLLHLVDRPLQRVGGLLRVDDDRRQQVRQVLVDLELDHLRVDQDELDLVGSRLEEDRRDERVDRRRSCRSPVVPAIRRCGIARRSSTTGSPWMSLPSASVRSDGELWNFSDSTTSRSAMISPPPGFGTSMPTLARPGSRSIADRLRGEREREVLREAHHLVDLDAGGRPELVRRDDRARVVFGDLPFDAELRALGRDQPARFGEDAPVDRPGLLALLEERHRRIRVALHRDRKLLLGGGAAFFRARRRRRGCGSGRRDRLLRDRELSGTRNLAR